MLTASCFFHFGGQSVNIGSDSMKLQNRHGDLAPFNAVILAKKIMKIASIWPLYENHFINWLAMSDNLQSNNVSNANVIK